MEVHSVRTALRRSPRGGTVSDVVVEITQRRRGYFDKARQLEKDTHAGPPTENDYDFIYRAGCTLLLNPVTMEVRRVIRTRGTIADNRALERVRRFLADGGLPPPNAFWRARDVVNAREPFALLHRDGEV